MSWTLLIITGPLLYACANQIDKVLLTKYFKSGGVGTLMLFSSLLSIIPIPFLYYADSTVLQVDLFSIFILGLVGLLNIAILWLYFIAMQEDEASIVVVFYQLVPVIGYVLGYFILGETLTHTQLIAMAVIIIGATTISFDLDAKNKFKVRGKTILCMSGASFFWALSSVIFKAVAMEENVLRSLFWEHITLTLFGVGLLLFGHTYRKHFYIALKENSKKIIGLNVLNESIYIIGTVLFSFAYTMAPVALTLLANSFQAFFVLAIGFLLTIFLPNVISEKIESKFVWQKITAICITGVGTYFLLSA